MFYGFGFWGFGFWVGFWGDVLFFLFLRVLSHSYLAAFLIVHISFRSDV